VARAQQPERLRWIAYITSNAENGPDSIWAASFRKGLEEHGWVEGRNVRIDSRFGEGDATLTPKLAKELVELGPDVIVAATTPAGYGGAAADLVHTDRICAGPGRGFCRIRH
jgi:putative ABC transport system substrate-binding protein